MIKVLQIRTDSDIVSLIQKAQEGLRQDSMGSTTKQIRASVCPLKNLHAHSFNFNYNFVISLGTLALQPCKTIKHEIRSHTDYAQYLH